MSKKIKCLTSISRFLNQKGQDVVEFALLCAFCVGIGLAAREAGLGEALDKAFAGTSDTAAPSAIEASRAEGTMPANVNTVIDEGDIPAQKPTKTDAKYDSTSDEKNLFNYLKDLGKYFKDSDTKEDDIWNAYKGEKQYASPDAEAKARHAALATLGANNLTDVSDDYLKALKEDNAWAFDRDDRTIHDFLNWYFTNVVGASTDDLKARNIYFTNISAEIINQMRNNENLVDGDVYSAYLSIKKQFWPNSVTEARLKQFAPVIGDYDTADRKSDEKKVFDYVKGLTNYFAKLDDKTEKTWNAFIQNQTYPLDSSSQDDKNAFTAMAAKTNIEDVDVGFWVKIKENHNWVRDEEDTAIYDFLCMVITDEANSEKTDDDLVEVLVAGNKQFEKIGVTDAGKNIIKQMVINAKAGKSTLENETVYSGYLAVKKEFWKENKPVALSMNSSNEDSLSVKSESMYGVETKVLNVTDENWSAASSEVQHNLMKKGTIFKYNDKYYIFKDNDYSQIDNLNSVMQYHVVEIKNNIIDEDNVVYRQDWWANVVYLNAGDIIRKNNENYIFVDKYNTNVCYVWDNVKEDNNIIKIE